MAEQGYLLIADISGYTAFLSKTAIDHGSDALQSLLNAIINHIRPPLTISKLEGDAVFAYAPRKSIAQGQTLLEAVEQIYFGFKRTLEENVINTTCDCNACRLMPTLDLKFALHYGAFTHQQLDDSFVELVGTDVNLVHRLMKNRVVEKIGIAAYLYLTEPAAREMRLGEGIDFMTPHTEKYDHIGEVRGYVTDMRLAWIKERELRRVLLERDEIFFVSSIDIDAPPSIIWDYLSEPEHKVRWHKLLTKVQPANLSKGRMAPGATHHCSHSFGTTIWYYRDWRPFDYFTFDTIILPGYNARTTISLTPTERGTHVEYIVSNCRQPEHNAFWAPIFFHLLFKWTKRWMHRLFMRDFGSLKDLVEGDISSGKIVFPESLIANNQELSAAVKNAIDTLDFEN